MKGSPGEAGHDDDPRRRLRIADGETSLRGRGLSSCSASPSERKGFSLYATRQVYAALSPETGRYRLVTFTSKRAATLRCVRSGVPGPNAAARAPATDGSRTTGGGGCGLVLTEVEV